METNQNPQNAHDAIDLEALLDGDAQEYSRQAPEAGDLENPTNPASTPPENPPAEGSAPASNEPGTPPAGTPPTNEVDDVVKLLTTNEGLLSADDKQLKSLVFNTFGASSVDYKGNLLDANGNVVLTAANLDKYIAEGEVPLDANGNQINALGQIVKQAEDVQASYNPVNNAKNFIEQELGINFVDEEGKPIQFDNSAEGVQQFAKEVALRSRVNAVEAFLNQNPTTKDFFFHVANGGKVEDYTANTVDYTSIDVTSLSTEEKMNYIKQSYDKQGVKNAGTILNLLKNASAEAVTEAAADALLALNDLDAADKKAREDAYTAAQLAETKRVEDYWNNVKSVIDKGNLKNLQIPATERNDFFKYIAEPINANGETREMVDANKEDPTFGLLVSYVRYKGGDISKFIQSSAQVNRLEQLKQRVGVANGIPRIDGSRERTNETVGNMTTPSIEQILG